ncbi:molybdopterin-dependent oxidoreductase [Nocardia terpenica]|uniref:Molybdopterin-dependent oxidoreductase n=1 Tax=Nocardia terpenica TaxID=455432 RepID=A0A6G9ZAU5_9NOCA|nr:molybdopterin-dependent oxidoreductase [Nocardia terpenica]QIS22477.1 molybdopterin-dependent oxidoreductase [Nocardia terpenica]
MTGSGLRAWCGLVSAGLALGVAELVSVPIGSGSSPLGALGGTVVDRTPDRVREWAIGVFGTNDKLVLFVLMGAAAVAIAWFAGTVEQARRPLGSALFALLGVVSVVAAVNRPGASWTWAVPSILGVGLAIAALRWLIGRVQAGGSSVPTASAERAEGVELDRRAAIRGIVGVGIVAAATGLAGRVLGAMVHNVSAERATVKLPRPVDSLPPIDPAADLRLPGLTPYLTANSDFYRIDTALIVPQVSTDTWSLRIHGMVDREIRLGYADLARRQAVERLVTLTCVSNPIGGDLVGNARWLGYRLDELLAAAGPHPDADMVLSRSVDGFTAGSPLATVMDGRDALLAIGMNGEPLPVEHGYPARLVVPGLYGYVSATKWVTDIEITRFDRAQAYWTRRGWSARGPIKTGTRIDTPHDGAKVAAGRVTVAGVCWAQHRGIRAVEVQIDGGPWQPTRLAAEPSLDTWRQWAFDWDAPTGQHTLRARATDGTGQPQTADVADVIPDGASGYPAITLHVG